MIGIVVLVVVMVVLLLFEVVLKLGLELRVLVRHHDER